MDETSIRSCCWRPPTRPRARSLGSELRRRYGARLRGRRLRRLRPRAGGPRGAATVGAARSRWSSAATAPTTATGLDFLRRAYALHPSAKRAVGGHWGDFASARDGVRRDRPRSRRALAAAAGAAARRGVPRRGHRRARRLAPGAGRRLRGGPADRRAARRAHPLAARLVRPQPHPGRLPPGRHRGATERMLAGLGLEDPELPVRGARVHVAADDPRQPHRPRDRRRLRTDGAAAGRPRVRRRGGRRRARPAWRPRSTRPRRACRRWSSSSRPSAARPAPAR